MIVVQTLSFSSGKLFDRGEGVFDPGDRPPFPDQAVDPSASRVRASVEGEDDLVRLFVDPYEANVQGASIERHLMGGVE